MLVAAAFCPHPPLLLPELASGAASELDSLRTACDQAVISLTRARPGLVLVVGAGGDTATRWSGGDGGDLAGYGVPLVVPLDGPAQPGRDAMPLSVTVGAWLLARAARAARARQDPEQPVGGRLGFSVPESADDEELRRWAGEFAGLDERLALLVMGDGSARRSEQAPGYLDPRSEPFDAGVATALAAGDPRALCDLDATLGATLLAAGTPAWRLAGWIARAAGGAEDSGRFTADLLHDAAPYGVGYLVATWSAA